MDLKLDLSKAYGIVLEGGGARGAYQIGAWKALREAGIRIRGTAGASVGALNGALICMDDFDRAEQIWENIDTSQVMEAGGDILENVKKLVVDHGFDVTPLKNLIAETVDEEKIRSSDCEFYLTTFSVTDKKLLRIDVKAAPEGTVKDLLLASAYLPVFKIEKMNGKTYIDGAGLNNVPIDILLEHGYKDIIVIRIYGLGFDSEKIVEIPEDVNVYHIAPRQDLGGILEFDKKKSKRNMKLGYYDAMRMLYGLEGKHYYIDAPGSETYYFEKMMSEAAMLEPYMTLLEGLELKEADEEIRPCRFYTEQLFPAMAKRFKLKGDWDYKTLYLAYLEYTASSLRINRFHIYTVEELVSQIQKKLF